jgi:hypothetical protein
MQRAGEAASLSRPFLVTWLNVATAAADSAALGAPEADQDVA